MPQLDLTTYSSQIFWFTLCFIVLYICVSQIILPRIAEIIKNRKTIVDADLAVAKDLDEKTAEIEVVSSKLRKEATEKYQSKLDEAVKSANTQREKMIETLKNNIDENIAKSHAHLKELIAQSEAKSADAIKNITQQIEQKLTNA